MDNNEKLRMLYTTGQTKKHQRPDDGAAFEGLLPLSAQERVLRGLEPFEDDDE